MPRRIQPIANPSLRATLGQALASGAFSLPDALRAMRAREGLTQAEFASRARVALKVIKEIENGQGNPTLESMRRIAALAGLQVGFFKPAARVHLNSADAQARRESVRRRATLRALQQGRTTLKRQHARNALRGSDFTIELASII